MESQYLKIKLPNGTRHKVWEWCKTFWRQDDHEPLFAQENVQVESLYFDEQPDAVYLIFHLKSETLHHANVFLARIKQSLQDFTQKYLNDSNRKVLGMISYLNKMKDAE